MHQSKTTMGIRAARTVTGFTLIEVMLAMAITAFVALLAYSGLSNSIAASQQQEKLARGVADIQLPLTVLARDVSHAVARPIKDEYGEKIAAMTGGSLNDYLLMLTRQGWDNPRGLARGGLQRVRYVLEDDELWRESWTVLDRLSEEGGQQRTLLISGVTDVELLFLNPYSINAQSSTLGGEWVDQWDDPERLPKAIEIRFDVEGFGEVKRVFSIAQP